MKHIEKGPEPQSLTSYNKKVSANTKWKSFNRKVKNDVYDTILHEQGYICCYCGIRISRKKCHIEHYRPKSKYTHLTFAYSNLISSCQGEDEKRPTKPVHCGHKKGGWFDEELMISPLDPNCSSYFRYTGAGEILPSENSERQEAAETTIKMLALDINKLKKMRRKAVDGVIQATQGLSKKEIKQLAEAWLDRDSSGRYEPFWATI
ncbi:MAG: retron system putative HNH endonuclease, partial [Cyanobacteria bacterium J06649_11]